LDRLPAPPTKLPSATPSTDLLKSKPPVVLKSKNAKAVELSSQDSSTNSVEQEISELKNSLPPLRKAASKTHAKPMKDSKASKTRYEISHTAEAKDNGNSSSSENHSDVGLTSATGASADSALSRHSSASSQSETSVSITSVTSSSDSELNAETKPLAVKGPGANASLPPPKVAGSEEARFQAGKGSGVVAVVAPAGGRSGGEGSGSASASMVSVTEMSEDAGDVEEEVEGSGEYTSFEETLRSSGKDTQGPLPQVVHGQLSWVHHE